jgi:CHAT domain-containing protein
MNKFYLRLAAGEPKARAVQGAMKDLRYEYPHPYHWAPFLLIGKNL